MVLHCPNCFLVVHWFPLFFHWRVLHVPHLFLVFHGCSLLSSPSSYLSFFISINCSCCFLVFLEPNIVVAVGAAIAVVDLMALRCLENREREGG